MGLDMYFEGTFSTRVFCLKENLMIEEMLKLTLTLKSTLEVYWL